VDLVSANEVTEQQRRIPAGRGPDADGVANAAPSDIRAQVLGDTDRAVCYPRDATLVEGLSQVADKELAYRQAIKRANPVEGGHDLGQLQPGESDQKDIARGLQVLAKRIMIAPRLLWHKTNSLFTSHER
jgi:hypothetical protein